MPIILDNNHYFGPNGFPVSVWKEGLESKPTGRINYISADWDEIEEEVNGDIQIAKSEK